MKVQIVRLVIASCMTFLVVYCFVYAMGASSASRNVQSTAILAEAGGEAELDKQRDSKITPVKVTPVAEPEISIPAQSDSASKVFQIDESWFQGTKEERGRFARLLRAEHAPPLSVSQWTNTSALDPEARERKIVVVSFWSTWCQPCLSSIDFNNKLYRHYKDKDVTFIGVCANEGSEDMAKIVESKGIKYPVCSDLPSNKSILAFKVQAIPSYFVIDRTGRLRFADVKRGRVDDAIEYLLSRE